MRALRILLCVLFSPVLVVVIGAVLAGFLSIVAIDWLTGEPSVGAI